MEGICRCCLVKCNDASEIYCEKNRRLFVYSTGIQVKHGDAFLFQLCQECYSNMKVACKFKKSCRSSERKFKNYLCEKELDNNLDFSTFLKRNDDSVNLRLSKYLYNNTANPNKSKDDDNVSTTTSIRNFLKDILQDEEIPDSEARIINEVIHEEADISDESLDSHWLQDDASGITDFRLDFCLSPLSSIHSIANDHSYTLPYEYHSNKDNNEKKSKTISNANIYNNYEDETIQTLKIKDDVQNNRCVIDKNLDKALQDESTDNFALDELLATPPMIPNAWAPSTPTINNILFGDRLEDIHKSGHHTERYEEVHGTIELDEFLTFKSYSQDSNKDFVLNDQEIVQDQIKHDVILTESNNNGQNETNLHFDQKVSNENHMEHETNEEITLNQMFEQNEISQDFSPQEGDQDSIEEESNETLELRESNKHVEITDTNQKIVIRIKRKLQGKDDVNKNKKSKVDQYNHEDKANQFLQESNSVNHANNHVEEVNIDGEELNRSLDPKHIQDESQVIQEGINNKEVEEDQVIFKKPLSPIENKCCLETIFCKLCEKSFKKVQFLKMHMTKKHQLKINTPYIRSHVKRICDYCGKESTASLQRFLKHIENHLKPASHICGQCNLTFSSKARLAMHQRSHTGAFVNKPHTNQKKYVCELCGGSFTSSNYKTHLRRHYKDYLFKCAECDAGFYRKTDYNLHMSNHTGERPWTCIYCPRTFKRRDVLNIHIRRHTGERPFKCNICDKTFTTAVNMKSHQSRGKECLMLQEKLAFPDQLAMGVD